MTPSFSAARRSPARLSGFTLIEMLVVISIIALLLALAMPALVGTIQGNRLSAAGQNMIGRLSQAQQTASSLGLPVEVRFYQFTDVNQVSTGNNFGAYQFLVIKTTVTTQGAAKEVDEPLSAPFYVESGVFISGGNVNGQPASPLLSGASPLFQDDGSGPGSVARQVQKGKANFAAIRFLPDGTVKRLTSSTDSGVYKLQSLNLKDAYLTLVNEKDLADNNIANYYAVQLDPYTGHARSYQPHIGS